MRHDLPLPSFPNVIVDLAVDGPRCATRRDRHDEQKSSWGDVERSSNVQLPERISQ
jgi:hypothetical protein